MKTIAESSAETLAHFLEIGFKVNECKQKGINNVSIDDYEQLLNYSINLTMTIRNYFETGNE